MSQITKITEPGVYEISKDAYHADPCETPSLSCSIAKVLRVKAPVHAWLQHPRLNPKHEPKDSSATLDNGDVAHNLLLGDEARFAVIDPKRYLNKDGGIPKGWTNDAIKKARAQAYIDGATPILPDDFAAAQRMVKSLRSQLSLTEEATGAYLNGKPEQTLVWWEEHRGIKIWFRIRLDWLGNDGYVFFDDYKSTADASPDFWMERQIFNMQYDFQCAFYRRGIRAVLGIENPRFRFIAQENTLPFAAAVYEPVSNVIDLAEKEVNRCIEQWAWCMANKAWPGYPRHTILIGEAPVYHEKRILAKEAAFEYAKDEKIDLFAQMIAWQSPFEDDEAEERL